MSEIDRVLVHAVSLEDYDRTSALNLKCLAAEVRRLRSLLELAHGVVSAGAAFVEAQKSAGDHSALVLHLKEAISDYRKEAGI